jgi:dipeptidyl-peptidase-4
MGIKKIFSILLLCALYPALNGQLNLLTVEKAVMGGYGELKPNDLYDIQWIPDSDSFSYIDNYTSVVIEKVNKTSKPSGITLDEINELLQKTGKGPLKYIVSHTWINNDLVVNYNNTFVKIDFDRNIISGYWQLPDNAENSIGYWKKGLIGFTTGNNLYFMNDEAKMVAVTDDSLDCIVNGNTVSRSEFGISNGIFWSPGGNKLAFFKKDECNVTTYPLVDILERPAKLKNVKYPMAGMKTEHVSLGIYDIAGGGIVYIESMDTSGQYITSVTWGPEEKYIYAGILNREQNHLKVNKYDALTGRLVNTLFEEKNQRYVEPEHPLYFLKGNTDHFIWFSERDGYNHLYLYNTKGEPIKQLTKGKWVVTQYLGNDDNKIYYISTTQSPLERHVYSLDIQTGKSKLLVGESGTYHAYLQDEANYIITKFENLQTPAKFSIINNEGEQIREISEAPNPLAEFDMPEAEIITLTAADDSTTLYGRIIKPHDFDPEKKYPAIVYVYGGPHAQLVTNEWLGGARLWEYYMAQQGYILFAMDNRGSANRGFEFESVIHRNLGLAEGLDQLKGIDYLKSLPYVHTDRLGIHGWSYGGFMTIYMSLHYPELFKVAVAGGPVIDWKYYEVMYGERYMDTPSENPEGYQNANLLDKCNNLQNHMLIIHGGIDPVVVWQHSLHFVHQCIKNKKQIDYFVYPLHEHNVRGEDRVHLMTKITRYFKSHL